MFELGRSCATNVPASPYPAEGAVAFVRNERRSLPLCSRGDLSCPGPGENANGRSSNPGRGR